MNLLELIDKRNNLKEQLEGMVANLEKEQRKFTETEDTEFRTLSDELKSLNEQIKELNEEKRETIMEKFSLIKTINNVVNKRNQEDTVEQLINLGKEELRKSGQNAEGDVVIPMEIRADITAASGAGIEKSTADLVTALRSNLVLVNAGATYMGGLTGNVGIPTYSGTSVLWKGETASAEDGAGSLGEIELKPKRLTAYVDVSKQFLIQESADAERVLREDIAKAVATKLESTILGDGAGSSTQPAGLLTGVDADLDDFDVDGAIEVDLELDEKNVQNKVYIISPKAKAAYRTLESVTGTPVFDGKEIFGYPTFVTTSVKDKGIVAGDFSDLIIAQWGGLDITVDPYTQADKGKIRLVVNTYFDAAIRRDSVHGKIIK